MVKKEIISANKFLVSSENILKMNEFDAAFLCAYNSSFHFLRALLFSKGFVEKSHYCLIQALKKLYSDESLLKILIDFDKVRQSRHEIQYSGIFSEREETEFMIKLTKK